MQKSLQFKKIVTTMALLATLASESHAATVIWTGGAGNSRWTNSSNWSGSVPGGSDIARFNSNTSRDPQINSNSTVGRLEFLSGTDSEAFTGSSRTLTINGVSGIGISNTSNQTHTFNTNIKLGGSQTWTNNGSGSVSLTFNRTVNLNGYNLTVDTGTSDTIALSTGSGDVVSGTGSSITKTGTGTLTFGNVANTYTGGTTISGGTVTIGNDSSLGTGSITLNGGTLNSTANRTLANAFSLTASSTISGSSGVDFLFTNNSVSTTGGTLTIDNTNNSGVMSVGFSGSGFNFSSDITFADANTELRSSNTSGTQTYSGVISGSGSINKTGTGEMVLSGDNTYSGTTTVSAGTLTVQNVNALGSTSSGTTVSSGASLVFDATDSYMAGENITINGSGVSSGIGALHGNASAGHFNGYVGGNITLGSDSTITSGDGMLFLYYGDINLGSNTLTLHTPNAATTSYIGEAANITIVNNNISGTGGLTKTGQGAALYYSANGNNYTGDTQVLGGKLIVSGNENTISGDVVIGNSNLLDQSGADTVVLQTGNAGGYGTGNYLLGTYNNHSGVPVSTTDVTIYEDGKLDLFSGSEGINSLTMRGGHVDEGNPGDSPLFSILNGITTLSSAQTAVIENGEMGMGNASFNYSIADGTTSNGVDLQIDSIIHNDVYYTGLTSNQINKQGTGTLVFTGANDYYGTTNVQSGILNIQNNTALGSSNLNLFTNDTVVSSGAQLQLENNITVDSETLTLNGTGISNDGALLNQADNNTYKGFIKLGSAARINANAGTTLTIESASGLSAAIINGASANTQLTVGGAGDTTVNGQISGNVGEIYKDGDGRLTLAGQNRYTGATTVTQGEVRITHNEGLYGSGATVSDGAALEFAKDASNNSITVNTNVASTINGTGVGNTGAIRNISGNNSYNGNISLASDSRINSDASSSLTLTGTISSSNKNLTVGGAGNTTITKSIQNGNGTLTKDGTGTVTLSGTNTGSVYSGLTTVDNGTLAFGASNVLTTTNTVLVNTNGTLSLYDFSQSIDMVTGTGTVAFGTNDSLSMLTLTGTGTFSGTFLGTGTLVVASGADFTFGADFNAPNVSIVLAGGTIHLNGTSTTFNNLTVTSSSTLDFSSSSDSVIDFQGRVNVTGGSTLLTVTNWVDNSDYFYSALSPDGIANPGDGLTPGSDVVNQIVFSPDYFASETAWMDYTDGPNNHYQIRPVRPVPEPSTYGALFVAGSLALGGYLRSRRRKSASRD